MKYLFIDTTQFFVTVALIKDNNIVALYNDFITDDMSSKIFPIIDSLFKKVDFKINNINKIYVVNGPGSFTGIRIGVTIAKVLASQMNIDICPISSLEYMASGTNKNCLALIDAKRGYVYAGAYDSNLNCIYEDKYVLLNDIDLSKYDKIVSYNNIVNSQKPNLDIIKIISKYKDKKVNPHQVNPNYLKLTEAEENRK